MNTKQCATRLILVATVALLPAVAPAQWLMKRFIAEPGAEVDPDFRAAGNRLDNLFRRQVESIERSSLIVTLSERGGELVDHGFPTDNVITLSVRMAVASENEGEIGRGFLYKERYLLSNAVSVIDESNIPSPPTSNPMVEPDYESDVRFDWEAVLYDGEQEYQWGTYFNHRVHVGDQYGSGFSSDPYVTIPGPPSRVYGLTESAFDRLHSTIGIGYQYLIDYMKEGRHHPDFTISFEPNPWNNVDTVSLRTSKLPWESSGAYSHYELLWSASLQSGLPLVFEQLNDNHDGTQVFISQRWHNDLFKTGTGRTVYFPSAVDNLFTHPSELPRAIRTTNDDGSVNISYEMVDMGLEATRYRAIVLHAEFDEPWHLDHPALEPDSLASWLGVALQWTNPEGATVTAVPPEADANQGIPHCELLMDLRQRVKDGDLVIEWPFGKPSAMAAAADATEQAEE